MASGAGGRSESKSRGARWRRHRAVIVRHLIINLFNLIILLPFAWVLLTSFKTLPDAMRGDFWPKRFDFSHYGEVFTRIRSLPINLFNSLFVTAASVALTTICAVLAGYALTHLNLRGGRLVVAVMLASLYVPIRVVGIMSVYEIQRGLGLINSTAGLILPYVALQLAVSIIIMRAMFRFVPGEVFDSAKMDGAGPWRALWEIGLPMVRNGVVVVIIVNFVAVWGEYLLCLTLIDDQTRRTIPLVLATAQGGEGAWSWPNLAAVYVLVAAPGLLVFTLAQRQMFKGVLEGVQED